jgi:hypothetical protein
MLRNPAFTLTIALSAGACSFDSSPTKGSCVEGEQRACSCGGRPSVRTCAPSSTFGDCACGIAANPSGAAIDASVLLPPAAAGSTGGMPGAAGMDATGINGEPGAGGAGTAGGAGSSGAAGTGSAAGVGGATGTGGEDGDPGAGGESGDGGDGSEGGSGEPPQPGDVYTRCGSDGGCSDGLVCTARNGGAGGYCTASCNAMTGAMCPQPKSGDVEASCFRFLCLLVGCQDAECPDDMTCVTGSSSGSGSGAFRWCDYPSGEQSGNEG